MLPVKVVDSIGENKAKLLECEPGDLAALRASHPSVRILPVVYFQSTCQDGLSTLSKITRCPTPAKK
jgi:hypothetical protein